MKNAAEVNGPVRILLLEVPQLLRGILEHAIQVHEDCEVMKSPRYAFEIPMGLLTPPDVVILGLTSAEDATVVSTLFARWPQAQVLTLMQAGDDAAVYELQPRRRALGQMSPVEIVDTMYEVVQRRREPPAE